jgi:hypothetical protein
MLLKEDSGGQTIAHTTRRLRACLAHGGREVAGRLAARRA